MATAAVELLGVDGCTTQIPPREVHAWRDGVSDLRGYGRDPTLGDRSTAYPLTRRGWAWLECSRRAVLDSRRDEELRTEVLRGDTARLHQTARVYTLGLGLWRIMGSLP